MPIDKIKPKAIPGSTQTGVRLNVRGMESKPHLEVYLLGDLPASDHEAVISPDGKGAGLNIWCPGSPIALSTLANRQLLIIDRSQKLVENQIVDATVAELSGAIRIKASFVELHESHFDEQRAAQVKHIVAIMQGPPPQNHIALQEIPTEPEARKKFIDDLVKEASAKNVRFNQDSIDLLRNSPFRTEGTKSSTGLLIAANCTFDQASPREHVKIDQQSRGVLYTYKDPSGQTVRVANLHGSGGPNTANTIIDLVQQGYQVVGDFNLNGGDIRTLDKDKTLTTLGKQFAVVTKGTGGLNTYDGIIDGDAYLKSLIAKLQSPNSANNTLNNSEKEWVMRAFRLQNPDLNIHDSDTLDSMTSDKLAAFHAWCAQFKPGVTPSVQQTASPHKGAVTSKDIDAIVEAYNKAYSGQPFYKKPEPKPDGSRVLTFGAVDDARTFFETQAKDKRAFLMQEEGKTLENGHHFYSCGDGQLYEGNAAAIVSQMEEQINKNPNSSEVAKTQEALEIFKAKIAAEQSKATTHAFKANLPHEPSQQLQQQLRPPSSSSSSPTPNENPSSKGP